MVFSAALNQDCFRNVFDDDLHTGCSRNATEKCIKASSVEPFKKLF